MPVYPSPDREKPFSPNMLFREAARAWLESRSFNSPTAHYLRARTLKCYRCELDALTLFFGHKRLCDITLETIRSYQAARSAGRKPFQFKRHPRHINAEVKKLVKILERANLWHLVADGYEPLATPFEQPRRVMTKQEETHFFRVASSRPEFAFIYAYCLLSVHTSASGAELRGLRLRDVDLIGHTLQVNAESAKNPYRVRTIPLVPAAIWAANSLLMRAREIGCTEPEHYLLPYRHGNAPYDPTKPMSDNGMQARWFALRDATGMRWVTPHLLRYQCITKMAEGNVDRITAKKVAGHITDKMWEKYAQVRMDSTRAKMAEAFGVAGGAASQWTQLVSTAEPPQAPASANQPRSASRQSERLDLADPEIQAEIRRQVELALAQRLASPPEPIGVDRQSTNLVSFPQRPA